jgi:signal recognition particle subunit SRP54
MINSMTPKERAYPKVINSSRKKRIAKGSGTEIRDINKLLKQFEQARKLMKKMTGGGGKKHRRMSKRFSKHMFPF